MTFKDLFAMGMEVEIEMFWWNAEIIVWDAFGLFYMYLSFVYFWTFEFMLLFVAFSEFLFDMTSLLASWRGCLVDCLLGVLVWLKQTVVGGLRVISLFIYGMLLFVCL